MASTANVGSQSASSERNPKVKVIVYSGSNEENVTGFIDDIKSKRGLVEEVIFFQLPYNVRDMKKVKFNKKYLMLLCHSINNRRFSITNVTDSLYDDFLRRAKKKLGQNRVGVIAHDFPSEEIAGNKLESRMAAFRSSQERTFRKSVIQLIGGQMSKSPAELTGEQWEDLERFLRRELKANGNVSCITCQ